MLAVLLAVAWRHRPPLPNGFRPFVLVDRYICHPKATSPAIAATPVPGPFPAPAASRRGSIRENSRCYPLLADCWTFGGNKTATGNFARLSLAPWEESSSLNARWRSTEPSPTHDLRTTSWCRAKGSNQSGRSALQSSVLTGSLYLGSVDAAVVRQWSFNDGRKAYALGIPIIAGY